MSISQIEKLERKLRKMQLELDNTQNELITAKQELKTLQRAQKFDLTESGMYLIKPKPGKWADTRLLIKSNESNDNGKIMLVSINASGQAGHSSQEYWLKEYDVVKKFAAEDLVVLLNEEAKNT